MALQSAARQVFRFRCLPSPLPSSRPCSTLYYHHRHLLRPRDMVRDSDMKNGIAAIITKSTSFAVPSTSVRSPDIVELEYAELNLSHKVFEEVGHVRIRQHVNPLRFNLCVPPEVPDWNTVFKDPTLPLVVDIGCGSGRFLLCLAKRDSGSKNFLGLEIREKLVKRANVWVEELDLCNAYFVFANATVSLQQLVSTYPGQLVLVFILCPDPHFKRRHHKRRVVQKPLVESVVNNLASGGQVFVQSDVLEVAVDMRSQFDAVSNLRHMDAVDLAFKCDQDGWLLSNPMGIRTEREIHAELEGAKIYRRMYQKGS